MYIDLFTLCRCTTILYYIDLLFWPFTGVLDLAYKPLTSSVFVGSINRPVIRALTSTVHVSLGERALSGTYNRKPHSFHMKDCSWLPTIWNAFSTILYYVDLTPYCCKYCCMLYAVCCTTLTCDVLLYYTTLICDILLYYTTLTCDVLLYYTTLTWPLTGVCTAVCCVLYAVCLLHWPVMYYHTILHWPDPLLVYILLYAVSCMLYDYYIDLCCTTIVYYIYMFINNKYCILLLGT